MKLTKAEIYSLSSKQIFWILLSVVISTLPHIPRLPIWFPILLLMAVTIRWLTVRRRVRPLPGFVVAFMTVFLTLVIVYVHGIGLNRELSVTILAVMTVLKVLETWRKRDAWMVVTLCYFVILTRFFYSQDILLILYLLVSVLVITHTLFVLQHNDDGKYFLKSEIKQTSSLMLAGIPLAALFFLFFPRLGSPIWGSPDFFGSGKTGISEEMSPGSISQLFSDDSTAFRVVFDSEIPEMSQLYWRGPVLWDFDGMTWSRNKKVSSIQRDLKKTGDYPIVHYEVELEPTGQKYLFALDYVVDFPSKADLKADSQLMTELDINQLRHYKASSVIQPFNPYESLSRADFERLLGLPTGYNSKTQQLVQTWKSSTKSPLELIQKILQWFAEDEFYYSYTPPLLQGDTVDQFLFETKSGFCEHYASAFTYMMRAAGVPARIVTGYQGGTVNEEYLQVKQSDAHAWSEVWIHGKGWMRVDPTAAVSPLRVERGSQALISENSRSWHDTEWYRKLGEKYDRVRHKWNKWIREYNALKQKALFQIIGFEKQDAKAIVIVLGIIMLATTVLVMLFLYLTRPKQKLSQYDKVLNQFIKLFAKDGLTKLNYQGVIEYSESIKKQYPQLKDEIDNFIGLYIKLRFSKSPKKTENQNSQLQNYLKAIRQKMINVKKQVD